MTPPSRALGALPVTFLLYVFEALLAVSFALPLGLELTQQLGGNWDPSQTALALESVTGLASGLRVSAGSALLSLALLVLLSPWLQMTWLSALSDHTTTLDALSRGARLIARAWWVSLLVLVATALTLLPFGVSAYAVHRGLMHATDARFHDLLVLAAVAPAIPVLLFAHLVHDLARATALERSGWQSVSHALRVGLRVSLWPRALALPALGYGMVLLAELASFRAVEVPLRFLLTATALQSALLARTFLRSLWLASALTCVEPPDEPGPDPGVLTRADDD